MGGAKLSPIPKLDDQGRLAGYVGAEEVPHASRFGLPEKAPELVEGYNARNAPFGSAAVQGSEHLSSLKESYLRELAGESGLGYHRLEAAEGLIEAWSAPEFAEIRPTATDLRPWPAALALAALVWAYLRPLFRLFPYP